MEKCKKLLFCLWVSIAALFLTALPTHAAKNITDAKTDSLTDVRQAECPSGSWVQVENGFQFRLSTTGEILTDKWIQVDGKIYYLNSSGLRAAGWIRYRENLYYMQPNGAMYTGWLTFENVKYHFDKSGKMKTSCWIQTGKYKYYVNAAGELQTSRWIQIGKHKYYVNRIGRLQTSHWIQTGKYKYYVNRIGRLQTSRWIQTGKYKYYVNHIGRLQTSRWIQTRNKYYYVNKNGRMLTSCWLTLNGKKYYLSSSGARVSGEQYINGRNYYFNANGVYNPDIRVLQPVDPNKPMVALTFDDGPSAYTNRLLTCLEKNDAKATFFMVGTYVPIYSNTVKRMANLGCELGNHSYSHPAFTTLSYSSMQYQVTTTNNLIYDACGKYPTVFRLPYGDGYNNSTVLSALGLPSIFWTVDSTDWINTNNSQPVINAVLNNVRNGDIVTMHDSHYSTVVAAETIIPILKQRGYQLVTVSELAKYKGRTTLQSGRTYFSF